MSFTQSGSSDDGASQAHTYVLDASTDAFWDTQASAQFPDAISANEAELQEVTSKQEQITAMSGGGSAAEVKQAAGLFQAINSLPELMARKKLLEQHTNILGATFNEIASREVPSFYQVRACQYDGLVEPLSQEN